MAQKWLNCATLSTALSLRIFIDQSMPMRHAGARRGNAQMQAGCLPENDGFAGFPGRPETGDSSAIPVKQFEIPLADGHYVAIDLAICKGRLTSLVVRLMLREDAGVVCVARYDTAHGCPHRDLVSRTGRLLQKDWLTEMTLAEAANHAIQDFKENHETYFRQFTARK